MNKLIVGNQKMYMNKDNIISFVNALEEVLDNDVRVVICPSFPYLQYYEKKVLVGAQDVSIFDNGAHTGEVSATQLKSLNVSHCIVGHSERREYQNETDEEINKKINKLLENDIIPILCIGEKIEDREKKCTEIVLKNEMESDLKKISTEMVEKIIIAYEPIWAIGTGLTPTCEEIDQTILFIKKHIKDKYEVSNITVLYGGSVSDKNIAELNEISSLDGYLIGGASSDIETFKNIINSQK